MDADTANNTLYSLETELINGTFGMRWVVENNFDGDPVTAAWNAATNDVWMRRVLYHIGHPVIVRGQRLSCRLGCRMYACTDCGATLRLLVPSLSLADVLTFHAAMSR